MEETLRYHFFVWFFLRYLQQPAVTRGRPLRHRMPVHRVATVTEMATVMVTLTATRMVTATEMPMTGTQEQTRTRGTGTRMWEPILLS